MDSNVENILRNMVDGTTEYDPPHSRVEKLLIELKEALDAGGGGGTVDDVARNRINTHIDNSNVHVSTAEKSSWNNKVERSDLTAHTEDTAIHVTNNDKATWNNKAELSDIPTSLPANGGDADTLDSKHASEFMQFLGDIRTGSLLDYISSLNKSGFLYCGGANCTDMPVDGTYFMVEVHYYATVKEVKATSFSTGAVYTNRYSGSRWLGWHGVADGGNADTVDGLHANEIASNPNLLINPDFAVNQRGEAEYSGNGEYGVDCWKIYGDAKISVVNGGVIFSRQAGAASGAVFQPNERLLGLIGETVTLSVVVDGQRYTKSMAVPASGQSEILTAPNGNWFLYKQAGFVQISCSCTKNTNVISRVKVERGVIATEFVSPDIATELAKCQRYYQIRSTGDIAAVDLRPSMATIKDIKQRSDGNYEYIAEL